MAFYLGCYLIQQDSLEPSFEGHEWELPDIQHAKETSNVEELLMDPEDFDTVPEQIQFGCAQWTDDEGFTPDDAAYEQFYVRQEFFYVREFTPTDYFTEFYVRDEPFYVRGFAPTDLFTEFYVKGDFYVRGFSPTDHWVEFYVKDEPFYVRNFTGVDFFYTVPEEVC